MKGSCDNSRTRAVGGDFQVFEFLLVAIHGSVPPVSLRVMM